MTNRNEVRRAAWTRNERRHVECALFEPLSLSFLGLEASSVSPRPVPQYSRPQVVHSRSILLVLSSHLGNLSSRETQPHVRRGHANSRLPSERVLTLSHYLQTLFLTFLSSIISSSAASFSLFLEQYCP